jgi:flagellar motility protein MotE (MotC chaperone)
LKASIKSGTNNQEKTKVSAKVQERIKEAENRLKAEAKERLE